MNWLQYIYTRQRKNFGRQCIFTDRNELIFETPSDYGLIGDYILRNPVDTGTQLGTKMALSECNTENAALACRGMHHMEGGWPKDVNFSDEEQTLRYRKKIEREENWGKQVLALTKPAMHAVLQNNAVNIYQDYFADMQSVALVDDYAAHEINIYHDKLEEIRVIRNLSFNPSTNNLLLGTYGTFDHYPTSKEPSDSYIWDLTNPNQPLSTLTSPSVPTIIEWCPKDSTFIAGGLASGIVAVWDHRAGEQPVSVSPLETTHREGVSALCFVHSKSNKEFYTGSVGGAINYWDARNLEEPVNQVILDPEKTDEQSRSRAHGCTVLEFEYTIPIRFMAGTDHGYVFLGNRKGLTPTETLVANFRTMSGPVRGLERNPVYVKNFLVLGDWCSKIWTEECKDNPIVRTKNHTSQVTCGTWSKGRCSLFFTGHKDGTLHLWDLIMDHHKPIYTINMFKSPISTLRGGNAGHYLAVGTHIGNIHLIKVDDALTYNLPKERLYMGAMFERDTRRVKLLEGRIREIKLKMAQENKPDEFVIEEEEEEVEVEEEETRKDDEVAASVSVPSEIEGVEEEEGDTELLVARNKFFEIVMDEEEKRKDKKYTLLTRTAFEPDFAPSEFDVSKYKPVVSPQILDDATRLAKLKAFVEERRALRKSIVDIPRISGASRISGTSILMRKRDDLKMPDTNEEENDENEEESVEGTEGENANAEEQPMKEKEGE